MSKRLGQFQKDQSGFAAIILALGAFPIVGMTIAAIGAGQQTTGYAQVRDVVHSACSRASSPMFRNAAPADRAAAAQAVLDKHLPLTDLDMTTAATSAVNAGGALVLTVNGEIPSATDHAGSSPVIAVSQDCDAGPGGRNAAPGTILFDSFEYPRVSAAGYFRWYIEPNLPGWTLSQGTGVEMVEPQPGDSVPPFDGAQVISLDSDTNRGALAAPTTNSAITRIVPLSPGTYRLSYNYHQNTKAINTADGEITVYIDPDDGSPLFGNPVQAVSGAGGWTAHHVEFDVDCTGDFRLSFAATDLANERGGYIDAVTLEQLTNRAASNLAMQLALSSSGAMLGLGCSQLLVLNTG